MMHELGFTFYPRDWWTSESFFNLEPIERYFYLECIFLMYVEDGSIADDKLKLERRLGTTIKDGIWSNVSALFVRTEDGRLTHRSVNSRMKKTLSNRENGLKGGRPKNPNNPNNPNIKPNIKPTENPPLEREIESKSKGEDEGENWVSAPWPTDRSVLKTIESLNQECTFDPMFVEHICRQTKIEPGSVTKWLDDFNEHLKFSGEKTKNRTDYRKHFLNWLSKRLESNVKNNHLSKRSKMREI